MKKVNEYTTIQKDKVLERMLRDRRAPLTRDAMNKLLADLTMYIARSVQFYAVFYPRQKALQQEEIHAEEIEKADVMEGTDGERYLPVFTDTERLMKWKKKLQKGEFIYAVTKEDLLDFLDHNNKVAAAVANPMEDDLILYRMQLQNMIKISSDNLF